jgi:trimeric autotransporter adhesin
MNNFEISNLKSEILPPDCLTGKATLGRIIVILVATLFLSFSALAQSSAFTYQGRLNHSGSPATGLYEITFALYDSATNGNAISTPITLAPVPVTNGLFTATLDFGANTFTGASRWLELAVTVFGSDQPVVTVWPRQAITSAPYAILANSASQLSTFGSPAIDMKVNGVRAFRLEVHDVENISGAPNVIGGAAANHVLTNVIGATIAGGGAVDWFGHTFINAVTADFGFLGGGRDNTVSGDSAVVTGGYLNTSAEFVAVVGGGVNNAATGVYAVVGGGANNTSTDVGTTVSGGRDNHATGSGTTVAGGVANRSIGNWSCIGGGYGNYCHNEGSTVAGGLANNAWGPRSAIGGGRFNNTTGDSATVAGGLSNSAADNAAVGGGTGNVAGGYGSAVSGGIENVNVGMGGTIAGGSRNLTTNDFSSISGGYGNISSNVFANVAGGRNNIAGGLGSFAAGVAAHALHHGAFVWADAVLENRLVEFSSAVPFTSSNTNEFSARATGGVRFVTAIQTNGSPTAGVTLSPGSGTWSSLSDRSAKDNFTPIDPRATLDKVAALPISTWNYKTQDKSIRHIGPTAQDFHAAFNVGENERTITTVDADGVALAAIQGLNQKLEAELKAKDAEIRQLQSDLAEVKQLLQTLANR